MKDGKRGKAEEKHKLEDADARFEKEAAALKEVLVEKLYTLLKDVATAGVYDYFGVELIAPGTKFTKKMLEEIDYLDLGAGKWVEDERVANLTKQAIRHRASWRHIPGRRHQVPQPCGSRQ